MNVAAQNVSENNREAEVITKVIIISGSVITNTNVIFFTQSNEKVKILLRDMSELGSQLHQGPCPCHCFHYAATK